MIIGEEKLRELYPGLDENQYQPAGIDLKLKKIMAFDNKRDDVFGFIEGKKYLPTQKELEESTVQIEGKIKVGYLLQPNTSYIAVVDGVMKIPKQYVQFYKPRSSCLRAGITVDTAVGDPGFNGHLSFLIVNHSDVPFFIQRGERFAQMVMVKVDGVINEYDGDYNE